MPDLSLFQRVLIVVAAILAVAALVLLIRFDMAREAASRPSTAGAVKRFGSADTAALPPAAQNFGPIFLHTRQGRANSAVRHMIWINEGASGISIRSNKQVIKSVALTRYFATVREKIHAIFRNRYPAFVRHMAPSSSFSTSGTGRQRPSIKQSAVRMRRLLDRRRRGFRCLTVEYCPADVDGLVRAGLLDRQHRDDTAAIERAVARMLERL